GDLRGWEHNYLFTLFTKNERVLKTRGRVTSLAYSPDGLRLVSAYAWTVRTWDSASGREILTYEPRMKATSRISSVQFSPDGKRIALGTEGQDEQVLDASSGAVLLTHTGGPIGSGIVAFSPDGTRIASSTGRDESIVIWDAKSGEHVRTFAGK